MRGGCTCEEGGGQAWLRAKLHQAAHSPPLSRTRWKKRMRKLMGHIKTGRLLTCYRHGQNMLNLGKINLSPIKIDLGSEEQRPTLKHHLLPLAAQGDGEWGLWPIHSSSSPLLLLPREVNCVTVRANREVTPAALAEPMTPPKQTVFWVH